MGQFQLVCLVEPPRVFWASLPKNSELRPLELGFPLGRVVLRPLISGGSDERLVKLVLWFWSPSQA